MKILSVIIFLLLVAACSVQSNPTPRSKNKSRYLQTSTICNDGSVVQLRTSGGEYDSRATHNRKNGRHYDDQIEEKGALTEPETDFEDDLNSAFRRPVQNNLQKRVKIGKQDQIRRQSGKSKTTSESELDSKEQVQRQEGEVEWIPGVTCPWGQPPGYWCDDRLRDQEDQEDGDVPKRRPKPRPRPNRPRPNRPRPNRPKPNRPVGGGVGVAGKWWLPILGSGGFSKTFHLHYHNDG